MNLSGPPAWPDGNRFPDSFRGFHEPAPEQNSPNSGWTAPVSNNPGSTVTTTGSNTPVSTVTILAYNSPAPPSTPPARAEPTAEAANGQAGSAPTTPAIFPSYAAPISPAGRNAPTAPPSTAILRSPGETSPGPASENGSLTVSAAENLAFPFVVTVSAPIVLADRPSAGPTTEVRTGNPPIALSSAIPPALGTSSTPGEDLLNPLIVAVDSIGGVVSGLSRGALPSDLRPEAPFEAPPPQGLGLITQFIPFDRTALDESLARFLDRLGDDVIPVNGPQTPIPYPLLFVTALVAIEAARRWRRRLEASETAEVWKLGSPTLHGLS
jgi:hypothetical protein